MAAKTTLLNKPSSLKKYLDSEKVCLSLKTVLEISPLKVAVSKAYICVIGT